MQTLTRELDQNPHIHTVAERALHRNPSLEAIRSVMELYMEEADERRANSGEDKAKSPRILLVTQDENVEAVLKLVLHDLPHELLWAKNPSDVAEAASSGELDLIVGEAMIRSAGGFQLISAIKRSVEAVNTPVVLLDTDSFLLSLYNTSSALSGGDPDAKGSPQQP